MGNTGKQAATEEQTQQTEWEDAADYMLKAIEYAMKSYSIYQANETANAIEAMNDLATKLANGKAR